MEVPIPVTVLEVLKRWVFDKRGIKGWAVASASLAAIKFLRKRSTSLSTECDAHRTLKEIFHHHFMKYDTQILIKMIA